MDAFVPDAAFIGQTPEYYRTLSDLVHEYRSLVLRFAPRSKAILELEARGCVCVACLFALSEAEEVLRDGTQGS